MGGGGGRMTYKEILICDSFVMKEKEEEQNGKMEEKVETQKVFIVFFIAIGRIE